MLWRLQDTLCGCEKLNPEELSNFMTLAALMPKIITSSLVHPKVVCSYMTMAEGAVTAEPAHWIMPSPCIACM